MRLDVDQKTVGAIPITLLDNLLNRIEEEDWYADDYRNSAPNMQSTNSIPLLHSPLCATDSTERTIRTIEKRKLYFKYEDVLIPIVDYLKQFYQFKFYAAFLARLNANSVIGEHADNGAFLRESNRVHIPLKTNENVQYIVNDIAYYWQKGFIYEFDNTKVHGVKNNSTEPRIHLIVNLYNLDESDFERIRKNIQMNPGYYHT